jgi:hypothetical protein
MEQKKKFFLYDWDDNILVMPTKIILDKLIRNKWVRIDITSHQFRKIRKKIGINYRLRKDSFIQFRNSKQFEQDIKYSIDNKLFGPVFHKFINTIINTQDFGIITARGHSPKTIKEGIKLIIKEILTPQEKKQLILNLNGKDIDYYLSRQKYRTVSSKEFIKEFGLDVTSQNPEIGKKIALTDYVENVIGCCEGKISIGFSDDDLNNIKVIEKTIKEELKKKFPHINFVIYDTSNPKNVKKKEIN